MKLLLEKRWHRIPVVLVSAMLAIALLASGAFAANVLIGKGQIISQTVFEESAFGTITAPEAVDLDSVIVGGVFSQTLPEPVVVEVGPEGVGKYLHLRFTSGTVPKYKVFIVNLFGTDPLGETVSFQILRSEYTEDVIDASILLMAGTYTFSETVAGTAGDTVVDPLTSVAIQINLEDTAD